MSPIRKTIGTLRLLNYTSGISIDALMDPILHSPLLAEISQRILRKHRLRQQFYTWDAGVELDSP